MTFGRNQLKIYGINMKNFFKIYLFSEKSISLLIVGICSFLYAYILCNQTMPFAEGWYSYYAKCINEGDIVYKDFEYLFTPIYMYFIAGIVKIFGYKIIVLRILGVIFFVITTLILYLVFNEIFEAHTSCIVTITSVLYMQSVNVCIFYDYIKLMDIFSLLTVLFMIKSIKRVICGRDYKIQLILWGFFNSIFILIKQNMGILFGVFSLILLSVITLYMNGSWKKYLSTISLYISALIFPFIIFLCPIIYCGAFKEFIYSCGAGAMDAKGGMGVILFNWIINGMVEFKKNFVTSLLIIAVIFLEMFLSKKYALICSVKKLKKRKMFFIVFYGFCVMAGIFLCSRNQNLGEYFSSFNEINPYLIFLVCFALTIVIFGKLVWDIVRKENEAKKYIPLFALLGAFFAISYGAGTSGGLTKSESQIGIGVILALLFELTKFKYQTIVRIGIALFSFLICINCASCKIVNSYYWWEQTEASLYESSEAVEIPVLDGILVSKDTKYVYEQIYNLINEKTTTEDSIYCFPQIPIFYVLCNREDPGVYSKVQWFDVSTERTILSDINIIKDNPPKAILIYDVAQQVYDSHEELFNDGKASGTTKMREFLYNFIYEKGYTFQGDFKSGTNKLLLFIKETDEKETDEKETEIFSGGTGTREDPYLLNTSSQLSLLSKQVNEGRSFEGQYIRQIADIDLNDEIWTPIGIQDNENYFSGTYDGNGHIIRNLNIISTDKTYNNGLFGYLNGTVINLGIIGGNIEGDSCGVVASGSASPNAKIINCFTDVPINAKRAGGITDNFSGILYNCYSVGKLSGIESAGAISYSGNETKIENIFEPSESVTSLITEGPYYEKNTKRASETFFTTNDFVNSLNEYVEIANANNIFDTYNLKKWKFESTYPYPIMQLND